MEHCLDPRVDSFLVQGQMSRFASRLSQPPCFVPPLLASLPAKPSQPIKKGDMERKVTRSHYFASQEQSTTKTSTTVEVSTIKRAARRVVNETRKRMRDEDVENKEEDTSLVDDEVVSKKSQKKAKRGYSDPAKYAHLKPLTDHLDYELDILFCGINPGQKSAEIGRHFGHPTNQFWPCLFESGITPKRLSPYDSHLLPEHYRLGLTDLVVRPTAESGELASDEMMSGVPVLLQKLVQYRPRFVCFVGMGIANTFRTELLPRTSVKGKGKAKNEVGLQAYKIVHEVEQGDCRETLFFIVPSTSGRVTRYQKKDKIQIFTELKQALESLKEGTLVTETYQVIPVPSNKDGPP